MTGNSVINVTVTMYKYITKYINSTKIGVFVKNLGYAVLGYKALDTVESCVNKFVDLKTTKI